MKICGRCKEPKPHSAFNKMTKSRDGLQNWCRTCKKITHKEYRQDPQVVANMIAARDRVMAKKTEWYRALKESSPCTDCGNFYPYYVMQYDHIGDDKVRGVADLAGGGYPREMVLAEIAKCELVCANCHAIRTHQRHLDRSAL